MVPVAPATASRLHTAFAVALLAAFIAEPARAHFTDVTQAAGLSYTQFALPVPLGCFLDPLTFGCETEWLTGGAATADVDGDGWPDLYVTRLDGPDILFRNRGDGTFEDITEAAGLAGFDLQSNGAGFVDIDNDGDADLYVLTLGAAGDPVNSRFYLFLNDGTGHFIEEAVLRGADVGSAAHRGGFSVAFGDYDRDGWIDIYTTEWRIGAGSTGPHSRLLRNLGPVAPGHFEDRTSAAGVEIDRDPDCLAGAIPCNSFAFAPAFVDLDGDGWVDLAIAADFGTSLLFWNNGDGTFTEGTVAAGVGTDENGMGSTFGDFDGNGKLDWFVTSIFDSDETCQLEGCGWSNSGNRLYRNEGGRVFSDATDEAGVRDGGWGWGAVFFDADHDGDLDLVMTNGVDFPQTTIDAPFESDVMRFWENDGTGVMTENAAGAGFTDTGSGKGLLAFDYDLDGDLDIFVVNNLTGGILYRNDQTTGHHWLRVKVEGGAGFNRDGIGAVVTLQAIEGGPIQVRHIGASSHFLGESERIAHFGLGTQAEPVHRLTVEWPGHSARTYEDVAVDQHFVAIPEALEDSDGDGFPDGVDNCPDVWNPDQSDVNGDGIGDACQPDDSDGDGWPDADDNCPLVPNPGQADVNGDGIGDVCQPDDGDGDGWPDAEDNCPSVWNPDQTDTNEDGVGDACSGTGSAARQWNEELLGAISRDFARPTVHARNLFHVSAAMWDAWAAYDDDAETVFHEEDLTAEDVDVARAEAISFAAYRILRARFADSPGAAASLVSFDQRMQHLGYDKDLTSTVGDSPASLGNRIAETILAFGLLDGSNEANDYANQYYTPANPPLIMSLPGNPAIVDLDRWQPLALSFFIDQSGNPIPGGSPPFLSPEWGQVSPFSLDASDATIYQRGGFDFWVYHDPGPPPLLAAPTAEDYLDGFEMVATWSSHLDPSDGVLWDISPASQGNAPLADPGEWREYYDFEEGGDWGTGYPLNPVTGEPYTPQIVPRGDYARVLAEYWADGPDSATPPGHWFLILNDVNDNLVEKRLAGEGPVLDELEWDVKAYLTLGGTMHDVAVAVWGMKGWYDYIRPVSVLRAMAERGQRSDPGLPSYHPEGFELRPGFIELVTAESSAPGERHEHLAAHMGEVVILAWRGPDFITDPETDVAGVGWIRAVEWWPYQRPSFVTPPFAGFPSGHSAFSRAAASILHQLTGSPWFPNGLGEVHAAQNEFLVFEDGPSVDIRLQYASYYDASDQTSLSRIWGGIHPPQDDLVSRHIGAQIATDAFAHALGLFEGEPLDSDGDGVPDVDDNCPLLANPDQLDTDGDGIGDVCDDLCVGEVTTLTGIAPPALRQGALLTVSGTGFGPAFAVRIGAVDLAPQSGDVDWIVSIPAGGTVPTGVYPVRIVNPEGCRSQENVFVEILPPGTACGLVGIEPFALLFGLIGRQRLRQRFGAR